jgi:hypothetical protein
MGLITKNEPEEPVLTLREEATVVITEWRDALNKAHMESPSEANIGEIYLVHQLLGLLDPTPKQHYQS